VELVVPVQGGQVWADDSAGSAGDGAVLVLLHPGWGDSSIWKPLLGLLPPRSRVIRYDARGYGRSAAPHAPYTELGDLMAVLDYCGVGEAFLVGHSGGGASAIGLALAEPDRVRGLLLLAPGVEDYPWPQDDPYIAEFKRLFAAGDRVGLAELGLRTWAAASPDEVAAAQVRGAVDAFYAMGEYLLPDPPAYGRLGEIRAGSTVVIGDRDYPMVIGAATEIAARIPGCERVPVPGADHMLPLRAPETIAGLIAEFAL
jgi:3-oxoadipate enol-lactonase